MKCCLVPAAVLICGLLTPVLQAQPPANKPDPAPPAKKPLPIKISKETTYITEPLRPDGYPDYVAA